MSRAGLIAALQDYSTSFADEQKFINPFLKLLEHPDAFLRSHLPGHITGSAWIIDKAMENVLLVHHAKLNRWLQPGGHADGMEDVIEVAKKEAIEETGLTEFDLLSNTIFDIDIHLIPARPDFPAHDHYDVRILLQADQSNKISVSEESIDVKWFSLRDVQKISGHNDSMSRMVKKVQMLFA